MAQFASDAFTDTAGTTLSTHDAAWTVHASYTGTAVISDANRLRVNASGAEAFYWHSGAPATADYSVSADDFFKDADGGNGHVGVTGRIDTAAKTLYMARYGGGANDRWELLKIVTGTTTLLGSSAEAITDETSHNVLLKMVGTTVELFKDGGATATVSVTDSSISAAGKSGVYLYNSASANNTTGIHLDNFSADDVSSGVTGTGALTTATTTASGTGTLSHTGTGAPAISAVTASGTGVISHTGTGAATISAIIAAGSGVLSHTGTGAITIGAVTASGSGFLGAGVTGTGALTINNITVSGTGTRTGWDVVSAASGTWTDKPLSGGTWTTL